MNPLYFDNRRGFVKKTLATSVSISFAGLIRAHGEWDGNTTVATECETTVATTTWDPDLMETTAWVSDPEETTVWVSDPEETTVPFSQISESTDTIQEATEPPREPEVYVLACVSEPLDGDWGVHVSAIDTAKDPSNFDLSTAILFGQRAWATVCAITNYLHPTWGKRCIRQGMLGRQSTANSSVICAAAVYRLQGRSIEGVATKKAIPKMRLSIVCDSSTGNLNVSSNGSGEDNGTWDGSPYKAYSKVSYENIGGSRKHIKVKVEWGFSWEGFDTAAVSVGIPGWARLVRLGAALNNGVFGFRKTAEFEFRAMTPSEYEAHASGLLEGQAKDVFDGEKMIRAPRGTSSEENDNLQFHAGVFVNTISQEHRGFAASPWEF